ncbi:amidohydrolase family protein [Candidatus Soleaferrea massiliensis]|uniref:amidohydrolase family protein n=1 Tax=Candidatus Soleaferrea massiliensis TaxID=1470354 RepID=UPI00058B380E|nr:amidohydrolase family protein [Candidatus Soleaferrea massiliensis]
MAYDIIDAHAHIFPEKIAFKATQSIGSFYDIPMDKVGSSEQLIESGCRIGVSRYLVCSTATKPEQVESINDFIHAECMKHPSFVGLGTIHPDIQDPMRELERIRELGLHGVKLHPDFQLLDIDEERMIPLYKRCAELGLPILFHTGDDRYDYSRPQKLYSVKQRVPELTAIAAHFGGYRRWDEAAKYLKLDGIYFDTCSSLFLLKKQDALDLLHYFGTDKFFFGTDFPMWDHEEELQRFLNLGLDYETNKRILHDNFAEFMHLDADER